MKCNGVLTDSYIIVAPKVTVMRIRLSFLSAFFIICLSQPALGITAPWPTTPSRTALQTPYGTLEVRSNDYVYEAHLLFDGKKVQPDIRGIINITYAYRVGETRVVLIAVDTGSTTCAVTYHWMTIRKDGYQITEPFGSCSEDIRVATRGRQFVLSTPNLHKAGVIDTWVFDGHTVRRR